MPSDTPPTNANKERKKPPKCAEEESCNGSITCENGEISSPSRDGVHSKSSEKESDNGEQNGGKHSTNRTRTRLFEEDESRPSTRESCRKHRMRAQKHDKNIKEIKERMERRRVHATSRFDQRHDGIIEPRIGRDIRFRPKRMPIADIDTEQKYDSDLEEDFAIEEKEEFDPSGRHIYKEMCEKLDLRPVRDVINGLPTAELAVRYRTMDKLDMRALAPAIEMNPTLRYVDVSCNKLSDVGCCHLAAGLLNNYFITHLDLSYNLIGEKGICALADLLSSNGTIATLDLSGNKLGDRSSEPLQRILTENTSVRDLRLTNCSLGDGAGSCFRKALKESVTLTQLDLSWNHITGKSARDLCAGLKANISLTHLDLSWNGLADEGAKEMTQALKANTSLQYLDISNNRITKPGAIALSKAIQKNKTLREFRIVRNPIEPDGAQALIQGLDKNTGHQMILFDLSENPVRHDFLDTKHRIQESSTEIRILYGDVVTERYLEITSDIRKDIRDLSNMKERIPYDKVMAYCQRNGLRLKDLFMRLDTDRDNYITIQEMVLGAKNLQLGLSDEEVQDLFEMLDSDKDGYVEMKEMVFGDRYYREELRVKRRETEEFRQEILEDLEEHDEILEDYMLDIKNTLRRNTLDAAKDNLDFKKIRWAKD